MLLLFACSTHAADITHVTVSGHGAGPSVTSGYESSDMTLWQSGLEVAVKDVGAGYPDTSVATPPTDWSTPGCGDTPAEALRNAQARSEIVMDLQKDRARKVLGDAMVGDDPTASSAAAADYRLYMYWTMLGSELSHIEKETTLSAGAVRIHWTAPRCMEGLEMVHWPASGAALDATVAQLCRGEWSKNEVMIFEAGTHASKETKAELWRTGNATAEHCYVSCLKDVQVTPAP
ncbi:MAG: hypothetical protein GY884_00770 [Proteobacteria bacterium]|nr:hypothetical protein [Pseudomonadota bacterium]